MQIGQLGNSKKITNAKNRWFFEVENLGIVYAVGFLLRNNSNYLMQIHKDKRFKYSDFGGKTEYYDKDVYDTAMRELCEESNGYLNVTREELIQSEKFYCKKSKYLLFIVDTNRDYKKAIESMGDKEIHDNKPRTTGWISDPLSFDCHPRINKYFAKCLI